MSIWDSVLMRKWALQCLRFIGLAAFLLVLPASQQSSAQRSDPSARRLAITRVSVIDTIAGTAMPDMTVVIRDGRIVSDEKSQAAALRLLTAS
jgi:hypothetical protein